MDEGHGRGHGAWLLLSNALRAVIPARRFDVETVDVGPIDWSFLNQVDWVQVLRILLSFSRLQPLVLERHEIEFELQEVDGLHVLPCVELEDRGHEAVREEEAREPERPRMPFQHPPPHERDSVMQVLKP